MFHLKFQLSPKQPQTLWKLKKKAQPPKKSFSRVTIKIKKKERSESRIILEL